MCAGDTTHDDLERIAMVRGSRAIDTLTYSGTWRKLTHANCALALARLLLGSRASAL